ncbi:MAG: hypothetical protein AB7S71_22820, partial [Dongiaceae bacterium]
RRYRMHTSLQNHPASFDKLRMRENLTGTKKIPHPELVEGRTSIVLVSCKQLIRLANLCEYDIGFRRGDGEWW